MNQHPHQSVPEFFLQDESWLEGVSAMEIEAQGDWSEGLPSSFAVIGERCANSSQEVFMRVTEVAVEDIRNASVKENSSSMRTAALDLLAFRPTLCALIPEMLRKEIHRDTLSSSNRSTSTMPSVLPEFDDLSLIGDNDLQARLDMINARQLAAAVLEGHTTDLDTLVCSARGLSHASRQDNPLRPDVYLRALKQAIAQLGPKPEVASIWFSHCTAPLMGELRSEYRRLIQNLKDQGFQRVPLRVSSTAHQIGSGVLLQPVHGHADRPQELDAARTAHRLFEQPDVVPKILYSGDVDGSVTRAQRWRETHGQAAGTPSQKGDLLLSLEQLQWLLMTPRQTYAMVPQVARMLAIDAETDTQRVPARVLAQAEETQKVLAREVVRLMVRNFASDAVLPSAVRDLIVSLEPALLLLADTEPQFFARHGHPARELLDYICNRGISFVSDEDPRLVEYVEIVRSHVGALIAAKVVSTLQFQHVLDRLKSHWKQVDDELTQRQKRVVEALKMVQRRNEIASSLVPELMRIDGVSQASTSVVMFLCRPWAQVIAAAQLRGIAVESYWDQARQLVWSTSPQRSGHSLKDLLQVIPPLTRALHQGLELIDYPEHLTAELFKDLMALHLKALRGRGGRGHKKDQATLDSGAQRLPRAQVWMSPNERSLVGLMTIGRKVPSEGAPQTKNTDSDNYAPTAPPSGAEGVSTVPGNSTTGNAKGSRRFGSLPNQSLQLGAWFELTQEKGHARARLAWISESGSLLMLTTQDGISKTLSRVNFTRGLKNGSIVYLQHANAVDAALAKVISHAESNTKKGYGGLAEEVVI